MPEKVKKKSDGLKRKLKAKYSTSMKILCVHLSLKFPLDLRLY